MTPKQDSEKLRNGHDICLNEKRYCSVKAISNQNYNDLFHSVNVVNSNLQLITRTNYTLFSVTIIRIKTHFTRFVLDTDLTIGPSIYHQRFIVTKYIFYQSCISCVEYCSYLLVKIKINDNDRRYIQPQQHEPNPSTKSKPSHRAKVN